MYRLTGQYIPPSGLDRHPIYHISCDKLQVEYEDL